MLRVSKQVNLEKGRNRSFKGTMSTELSSGFTFAKVFFEYGCEFQTRKYFNPLVKGSNYERKKLEVENLVGLFF